MHQEGEDIIKGHCVLKIFIHMLVLSNLKIPMRELLLHVNSHTICDLKIFNNATCNNIQFFDYLCITFIYVINTLF